MPWKPSVRGEVPTLGYQVIDWIEASLAAPDRAEYERFMLYREQAEFVRAWYALSRSGQRLYHRGVLGRSRGWGKSPLLAALSCAEALGPVVFSHWARSGEVSDWGYAYGLGEPVGMPWSDVRTPIVHLAAVSEQQTRNTWAPVLDMLREEAPIHDRVSLDPMNTFVALPNRGRMEAITSSAQTIKGARPVFAVLDQTEEWNVGNGGIRLAATMRANAAKVGGTTLESPNAYIPGEGSVAEASASFWSAIREGRSRDDGLLYDHREAPADTDMSEAGSLIAGLRVAYGDSSAHPDGCVIHDPPCDPGHVDLDRLVATIWDPAQDVQMSRSDFLNQITHASDSWVTQPEWAACMNLDRVIAPSDAITLGFDGSRGRVRGKADATALVGCRVSDGHLFEIRVWEQPTGPTGTDWVPPALEVDSEVRSAFDRWNVVAFYADPSGWAPQVAAWEATFGRKLKVKSSANAPIAAWPRGKDSRVVEYVVRCHDAIVNRELTHDGSAALTRHVLNARRRHNRSGYLLYKKFPESPDKIDAAYAAVIAWKARLDALAKGMGKQREQTGRAWFR